MWLIISPAFMFDQAAIVQKEIHGRQTFSFIAMTILHVQMIYSFFLSK